MFAIFVYNIGSVLSFEVDKKPAFEIPLKDVSQATTGSISQFFQIFNYCS